MAGPNMELFKFGMYVFFPIAIMIHYGDPDWYRTYVLPDKSNFLKLNKMAPSPPRNQTELKYELEQLNKSREQKRKQQDLISSSSSSIEGSNKINQSDSINRLV